MNRRAILKNSATTFRVHHTIISIFILLGLNTVGICQHKTYVITAFGARPDGVINNARAIQNAIDEAAAAGGGKVIVPRGRFVTGVIHLKSNVELNIHEEAVLLGSFNRTDYGPSNNASALIVANNEKKISITGRGTIDGQCDLLINDLYIKLKSGEIQDNEWLQFNPWHQRRPGERNRPRMIEFINCDSVIVKNVHLQNGAAWIQNYKNCRNITIDSVHVFSNTFWNNDGIDLVDCKNARVTNCIINAADDGICLKSEERDNRCENIYIANCRVRSSASAIKLGTASHGGFKKITIRNIEVYDTYRSAIAIETVDGGILENIDIRHINAVNTGNAVFIRLGHRNKDSVYGQLKNVYIRDVKVKIPNGKPDKGYPMEGPEIKYPNSYKADTSLKQFPTNTEIDTSAVPFPHNIFPASVSGLVNHPVENVTLEDIELIYEGGGSKEVNYFPVDSLGSIPEAASAYPEFSMFGELPCWGLYVRHVKGLTLKNIKLSYINPDFRTACIFDDVNTLELNGFSVKDSRNLPVIILNNARGYKAIRLMLPVSERKAVKIQ